MDQQWLSLIIVARVQALSGHARVFEFTQQKFRAEWGASLLRLGLEWVGPPHTLRHSGPSRDAFENRRTLEDIRRRGRWSQIKSIQRYSKRHELVVHKSRLTPTAKKQGEELIANPTSIFGGEARDPSWSKAVSQALSPGFAATL